MSIVHEYKIYSERALETGRKASLWKAFLSVSMRVLIHFYISGQ
jgi:hypothetical protein